LIKLSCKGVYEAN